MTEYEIVIAETFLRRIPPSLVLRTVFAGSEVMGTVPLIYEYQIVGSSAGAPPPSLMLPHVASTGFLRSAAPLSEVQMAAKALKMIKAKDKSQLKCGREGTQLNFITLNQAEVLHTRFSHYLTSLKRGVDYERFVTKT
jgi:hypothetical protein